MPCNQCNDVGTYPLYDADGKFRCSVTCPDCGDHLGGIGRPETSVTALSRSRGPSAKAIADFTRVVDKTGILNRDEPPAEGVDD